MLFFNFCGVWGVKGKVKRFLRKLLTFFLSDQHSFNNTVECQCKDTTNMFSWIYHRIFSRKSHFKVYLEVYLLTYIFNWSKSFQQFWLRISHWSFLQNFNWISYLASQYVRSFVYLCYFSKVSDLIKLKLQRNDPLLIFYNNCQKPFFCSD